MNWLVVLLILFALTGAFLQYLIGKEMRERLMGRLFLSPVLGMVLLGTAMIFCLVVFDRFPLFVIYLIPGGLSAAALIRFLLRNRTAIPPGSRTIDKRDLFVVAAACVVTALLGAVAFKDGIYGDALSLWSFKARVMAESDSLRIPAFQDPDYYHYHKDYPLLMPAAQALLYRLSGSILDRSAKLIYPFLLLCTSLFLYFHLKQRFNLSSAITGAGFCLLTPAVCGYHPGICSAYMDIPLGCFTLIAFLFGQEWLRSGRVADALLSGVFIAAMALTKNEGLAAAGLVLLLFSAASMACGFRAFLRGSFCFALPCLLAGGAWFVFRASLPTGNSNYITLLAEGAIRDRAAELPGVILRFLQELIHFQRWGFLWVLTALTAPLWIRREGWVAFLFLCGMVMIQIVAVTVSPLGVQYQMASAVFRLPGQYAPLAAACIGIGFGRWMRSSQAKNGQEKIQPC
ncbi:MAG: hypothetical protein ABIK28_11495 [Planctomycetota bacterium]